MKMKKSNVILPIEISENTSIDAVVEHVFGKITESSDLTKTRIYFAGGNEFTIDLPVVDESRSKKIYSVEQILEAIKYETHFYSAIIREVKRYHSKIYDQAVNNVKVKSKYGSNFFDEIEGGYDETDNTIIQKF